MREKRREAQTETEKIDCSRFDIRIDSHASDEDAALTTTQFNESGGRSGTFPPRGQVFKLQGPSDAAMPFVGCSIMPHGSMVLDKTRTDLPDGAQELHDACMEAGKLTRATKPDLVVLHTPHGISLSSSLGVYRGVGAAGCKSWLCGCKS